MDELNQAPQIEVEIDIETVEELQAKLEDKLQALGASLSQQRDEWIRSRYSYGIDKRWLEDEDQYNAKDNINRAASQMMTSVEQGYPVTTQHAKPHRSTVFIGMTRQKANSAEARLADILLPTDDRNWGIQPTPNPKLMSMAQSDEMAFDPQSGGPVVNPETGQPVKHKEIARSVMEMARQKAKCMQNEIEDQLIECDYNSELRKAIHDAAVLGTGVIKGPIVMNRTRKAWQPYTDAQGEMVHQLEIVQELNPASFRVDPRNVWPDPACGEDIHDGKGIYERTQMTGKQVRDLAKQPGYMKEQLRKVLEEGPKRSVTMQELRDETERDQTRATYDMWEYWGEIKKEDLRACGAHISEGEEGEEDDELMTVSACVVIINNVVVKAYLNPLENGDLPYDFYVWEKKAASCWGYGIPYLMRAQQKVLNAAWRQMMDNAGVSSGPQIVVKPSVIQPADKQWQLSSRKIWYATDDVDDVSKAFSTFEFNSHQGELAQIIKMAAELADQETGVPMLMQGEKGSAPDTVGGMQMLMNNSNVVLRRLVKQFDDMVTKPHIRRYYDYNMMYNEDEEVKGDFTIDARGSSALLVRDIQNQAFLNLLSAGANPIYGMYLDTQKLFEKALQAQHIDPAEVFKSEEEIDQIRENQKKQAEQGPAPDPAMQVAQMRAEADMQRAQLQNQGDMAEIQARMQIAQQEADMKLQTLQQESQIRMQELALQREIEMLKMSNEQNLTLEQIKAKLADTAIKERGRKELFAAEQRLKLSVGSGI